MPFLPVAWVAKWAALKALGWAGVGRWAAARTGGLLTGSSAWAVVVVGLLIGGVVLWRWIDPPERTYTAAEVNADRLARENEMLRRAAAVKDAIIADRGRAAAEAEDRARGLDDENRRLRELAPAAGGDAFTDADPWLQRKRRGAGAAAGKAATR